jgi:hypothetical protein
VAEVKALWLLWQALHKPQRLRSVLWLPSKALHEAQRLVVAVAGAAQTAAPCCG